MPRLSIAIILWRGNSIRVAASKYLYLSIMYSSWFLAIDRVSARGSSTWVESQLLGPSSDSHLSMSYFP